MSEAIREALETPGGGEIIEGFRTIEDRMRRNLIEISARKGVSLEDVLRARGQLDGVELILNQIGAWLDASKKKTQIR
jgi:hypothetical protein